MFFLAGSAATVPAQEDPVAPTNRPDREALRQRAPGFSPEARQKMIREFREKHGLGATNRSDWEKRREEWKQLPPAERDAKLKEYRESLGPARREFRMNQQQRDIKRREIKERVDAQIVELQERKKTGPLTPAEERRLNRMQEMSKRLAEDRPLRHRTNSPATPDPVDVLPIPKKNQN